jgi:hypothetical protein
VGCLLVLFSAIAPRMAIVVLWLFTNYLEAAYGSWLWPTIGFVVLPTTTIAYAVAVNDLSSNNLVGPHRVSVGGVILVVFGVLIDLGLIGGSARRSRRRS